MKNYSCHASLSTLPTVKIIEPGKPDRLLTPEVSQRVCNHSPDGFNWGYGGSGPSQLALAILLDFTHRADVAEQFHQSFKWEFVAKLPAVGGTIKGQDIEAFLKTRAKNYENTTETESSY